MKSLLSLLIVFLLVVSQSSAEENKMLIEQMQPIAQRSLKSFSKLITKENYKQMGFEFPKEIHDAALGTPIEDYMVRLDTLKEYKVGSKADTLLMKTNQFIYPVLVKEKVRSSITISKIKEEWKAVSFGSSNFVKLVSNTLKDSSKATGLDISSYISVRVPALNLFFIAYRTKKGLMLVPLMDDARLKFKSGVSMKAEKVFSTILPDAKAHSGLPS
jgi:hypothetical protein